MFCLSIVAVTIALTPFVNALAPEWGQCGGIGWTGDTVCVSGTECQVLNDWFSQCLPSSSVPGTTATSSTPTTITSAGSSTTTAPATPSSTAFVTVNGQNFMLGGEVFPLVGANAYWVGLMGYSVADMNQSFADIAKTGATAVRTLGFNDVTTPTNIYYQLWQNGKGTVNTGPTGLGNFDNVVATAKANGLRLIITLTNNWSDYGGMDVYVSQITGSQNHDYFYTNPDVIAAFKAYATAFVTRYKDEPTILAWELANEPRCYGSTGTTSGNCTTETITNWAAEISAFIKTIDSNHLVGIGDEGYFNEPGNPDYVYQGSAGLDFNANLAISTIDFGTAHMYPESWGHPDDPVGWGNQWILDHATSQKAANKPVIMEEFGVTIADKASTYAAWYDTIVSSGLTGDLIWQAGSHLSVGSTPDDGYAVYPDDAVYTLDTEHAAAIKARDL